MLEHQTTFDRHESSVRSYCRDFPALFVRASGAEIFDAAGRRYIDFLAGCGALNYGHNDPDMVDALAAHLRRGGLSMAMDLHTDVKQSFMLAFMQQVLAPRGLKYRLQFCGPTGTNAVEAALKLSRKVTGRHSVLAFTNGFHGVTLGALAATGSGLHRMGLPLQGVARLPYDGYLGDHVDTAEVLERMLEDASSGLDLPAAVLLELVQGEGGLNTATAPWVQRVAAVAQRHGSLLIVDDVQAGCGRTGNFFSFEGLGITPDLVVLSKSISGFGLPMSLVLVKPEYDQWEPGQHSGTFRGNSHAMLTGTVALRKFWSDAVLIRGTHRRAETIRSALQGLAQDLPGSRLKGRGLMQGLQLPDAALAKRISRLAYEEGLIVETAGPRGEVLKLLPPLVIDEALLAEGLALLRDAFNRALSGYRHQTASSGTAEQALQGRAA